jgi:hypothetical protein
MSFDVVWKVSELPLFIVSIDSILGARVAQPV